MLRKCGPSCRLPALAAADRLALWASWRELAGRLNNVESGKESEDLRQPDAEMAKREERDRALLRARLSVALLKLQGAGDVTKSEAALGQATHDPADDTALLTLGRELRGLEQAGRETSPLKTHWIAPRRHLTMTLLRTCLSRPSLLFGLAVLLLLPPVPGTLHAAEFKLLFSDKPNDPAPQPSLPLRPTVQQQFFVYVQNNTAADDQVTVAVLAGGSPVDGLIETVPVKAGKVSPVIFGKPPAAAQPAAPAPPGDKAPAPKAQPPSLEEVKGSLQIRVLDKNQAVLDTVDLEVSRPSDYIKLKPMALYV